METIETQKYKPFKNGFPYKLLKYLYDNGKSAGIDVQKEIGLNAYFDKKGTIYYDRASQTFDGMVRMLQQKGLLKFLQNDFYVLTKEGKEFMDVYVTKR